MRILIIHNHYKQVGGEDTVYYAEAELLREHGNAVEMLSFSNNDVNSVAEKLQAALGVVYNAKSAGIIDRKIKEFQPDVVHVHNFFPLVSPAVFYVCKKHSVPVVMTLHNYRLICPSALLYYKDKVQTDSIHKVFPIGAIRQKVYRDSAFQTASVVLATGVHKLLGTWQNKVDRFIVLTSGAVELFRKSSLRPRPHQLVVKPNFTSDLGLGAGERSDYFLFVGRLTPEKGIETLLEAHRQKPFHLKVIGDGPLREQVEAYAAKEPMLEYLGFQKRERVVEELKQARALIFPSEWYETFGMTIVESFSTGTPVIAAKIGGAAHLVENIHNGVHYTPKKAQELTEQVSLLQNDTTLAAQLGRNARSSYLENFTPEANYKMLKAIYEDVIAENKKPASSLSTATKAGSSIQ